MSSCLDFPNTLIDSKLKEYREVFSFFDRDGGGTITTVELGQVMRTFGWNPSEGDLLVGKLYRWYLCERYQTHFQSLSHVIKKSWTKL